MANLEEMKRQEEMRKLMGGPAYGETRLGPVCERCGTPTVEMYGKYPSAGIGSVDGAAVGWRSTHTIEECVLSLSKRIKALEEQHI